jgi:hypothetical protein
MRVLLKVPLASVLSTLAACSSPVSPSSPAASGIVGQWSGSTTQGTPISFTVSAAERVTSITVAHNFGGCSGTQTFSNLDIATAADVTCVPGPCPPSITSYRGFSFHDGDSLSGHATAVHGIFFRPLGEVTGQANFWNFGACGDAIGVAFTATKR